MKEMIKYYKLSEGQKTVAFYFINNRTYMIPMT